MKDSGVTSQRSDDQTPHFFASVSLALFGLLAPMATFLLAVSPLNNEIKIAGLAFVAAVYAVVCVWSFSKLRAARRSETHNSETDNDAVRELRPDVLGDAKHSLGSSLRPDSAANGMSDPLTGLPNERSFFLVLENQLAESHRFRDERPLTVLAIDLRGFDELNQSFGHATADRALQFVAEKLQIELRKMDFLARSASDEFLVVLPTATEETATEIVARINEAFDQLTYTVDENQHFYIRLNFGTATFWRDGETAEELMQHAHLKKQQSKSEEQDNVRWFPKEYVN